MEVSRLPSDYAVHQAGIARCRLDFLIYSRFLPWYNDENKQFSLCESDFRFAGFPFYPQFCRMRATQGHVNLF